MTAAAACSSSGSTGGTARVTGALRDLYSDFYRRPAALSDAVLTDACLAYGGGIAMFWLHAVVRGEQGPAISDPAHWLLDSTLAFVGLFPVVLALLPLATAVARRTGLVSDFRRRVVYALALGASFAIVTAPGPVAHDLIAGAGTPLAETVTDVAGRDTAVAERNLEASHHSAVDKGAMQVLVGTPVYVASAWVAASVLNRRADRRPQVQPLPAAALRFTEAAPPRAA